MNIHMSNKPSASPVKFVKCFRHNLPVYASEEEHLEKDIQTLAKARKFEKKLFKKSELALTADKQAKKAARNYFGSKRCLQANMIEANARRPLEDRLSLHQIIEHSKKYYLLKNLNEPATMSLVDKSDGGFRQICNFGPVARGAQRMVLKLLRAAYTPAPLQFTRLGVKEAIQTALKAITEEGLHHVAEIDIKGHFPSFTAVELIKALPLPKTAVEQIVMAENATWTGPSEPTGLLLVFPQTPTGIPQGSAASSEVAIWNIAHLKMHITVSGSVIVNFADNFFVFANSKFALDATCNLLRSAIAKLPGGSFSGKLKPTGTVETGFPMLGCWIAQKDGQLTVWPTETNLGRLYDKVDELFHRAATLFGAAEAEKCEMLRLQAVQEHLRLRNFCHCWLNAYAFCDLDPCIEEHLLMRIGELECLYDITNAEVKAATDASVGKPDAYGHHAS